MANGLDAIFQVGKEGVNPNLIKGIDEALEKRELVKVSVLETCEADVRTVCAMVAERARAEAVQCIGRRFVLYRESKENKQIDLKKL